MPRRAGLDGNDARIAIQGRLQQGIDRRGRQIALRAAVEHHIKRLKRASACQK